MEKKKFSLRVLWLIFALEAFAILTVGPFLYSATFDNPTGISHQELQKFEEIYAQADYFVLLVAKQVGNGDGLSFLLSGSIIELDGEIYILTAGHIQNPGGSISAIRVYFRGGWDYQPAELVGYHRGLDVALLKFSNPNFVYNGSTAKLGDSDKLNDDDKIMVIGASDGYLEKSIGRVVRHWWFWFFDDYLICTAESIPGYSGGPILNTEGEIVAITIKGMTSVTAKKTTHTVGTKINAIKEVLAELKNGKRIE